VVAPKNKPGASAPFDMMLWLTICAKAGAGKIVIAARNSHVRMLRILKEHAMGAGNSSLNFEQSAFRIQMHSKEVFYCS
jgi:hypothetical protein